MDYSAAIFDMDGLLLDSERVCRDCFFEAARSVGYTVDPAVYCLCIGANPQRTEKILLEGHAADFPYHEINTLWRSLYQDATLEQPLPVKPGAEALLQQIAASGTPAAVATSTAFRHASAKLRNAGLGGYFECIVAGDQVARSKPFPDIYLEAAARLGVPAKQCIAFEDSENGVRAALAAGISVVQVPDLVEPSTALRSLGHTIIDSLSGYRWPVQGRNSGLAPSRNPSG